MIKGVRVAAVALLAVGVLTGCTEPAAAVLTTQQPPRYDRDAFGDGWADADGDCQDTRNEILIRDLPDEQLDAEGCKVLRGTLHDPYTGTVIAFRRGQGTSDDVQIDHVVPLSYAWAAGAWRWSADRREAFANDPANLRAVDGPTNNSKGARGPARWLPPDPDARCDYAAAWTEVLRAYSLEPEPADADALAEVTTACP